MPTQSFTDTEWRHLLKSQTALRKQEEELLDAQAEIIAKLMRIRKQDKLLRKRAGDFIARECEEISELEDLKRREKDELERLEKERVEQAQHNDREAESSAAAEHNNAALLANGQVIAATSEDPTLTQMIASADPNFSLLDGVDFDAFLRSVPQGVSSPSGSTVQPAGGSPSGSCSVPKCFPR